MEYKYNFTFIIPHKNIPDLLRRCVSTIPDRPDVQIIIVDDNSDPAIVDFDNFPYKEDPRVEVIFDKSGKRQGHARNLGIERARGKWILFADSDDFFFYSINFALDCAMDDPADIIYYKSTNLDSDTYQVTGRRTGITNGSIDRFLRGEKDGGHFIRYRHPAPWGKLIRSELIMENGIRFPEIEKGEDMFFSLQCGYYASRVDAHDVAIYCLTSRANNLTAKEETPSIKLSVVKTETDCLCFMKERGLAGTPVYNIIEPDVFSILERLGEEDTRLYDEAVGYMSGKGMQKEYIDMNVAHAGKICRKVRLVGKFKRIIGK